MLFRSEEAGVWRCAEVILSQSLGYGTYCFETQGLDLPDPWMVVGGFLWDSCTPPLYREMDIEYSRWGNEADACTSQYVVQPCGSCTGCGLECSEHCQRFNVEPVDASSNLTHYVIWQLDSVTFETYRGQHCGETAPPADLLQQWTAPASVVVPTPGVENFRLNLWLLQGHAPAQGHCIVITDFDFLGP